MPAFVGLHNQIYIGHLNLTGKANEFSFGAIKCNLVPSTTYADGGYACVLPGVLSGEASVKGQQDYAADVLDDEISLAQLGTSYAISVAPNPTGTLAAGDPAWLARGVFDQYTPMQGAVGDLAEMLQHLGYDAAMPQGKVAHVNSAETADGDGTAVALGGPGASQRLYAALHVTAYSGLTNVVFKIQSDDASNFSSATDRITFTTVTGPTSQFASVVGSFSSETHHRITWDVTGTGSVSFFATFGVI